MNVFVLCTGRCGSTTLIEACRHITNYTSAHESRTGKLGAERLSYPANHIEADNRLSWMLGRLDEAFGDDAFYVHLKRDEAATAASFAKRYYSGIMGAYRTGGILMDLPINADPVAVARDYCDTVNTNIAAFLKDKTHQMEFRLEHAKQDFVTFCGAIRAQVDMAAALSEFDEKHNAHTQRQAGGYRSKLRAMRVALHEWRRKASHAMRAS
jgi:hypothetical protein